MGPIARARAKELQNLVFRVLLDDLGADEAYWINSLSPYMIVAISMDLICQRPQEESAKDANGVEEAKAG